MLDVHPAGPQDAAALLALREAAAGWQQRRGIEQWLPGEVSEDEINAQVAAGEWFVVREDAAARAACRLLWPTFRRGGRLLSWAGERTRDRGRSCLRLDCVQSNERLRAYYRELGFREVGRKEFAKSWHPVVLLERPSG